MAGLQTDLILQQPLVLFVRTQSLAGLCMCCWMMLTVLQEVVSTVPPPQAAQLFGREVEEEKALLLLRGVQRYVELRGGPGEGKSTLACHLAQWLCSDWELLPKKDGSTARAHQVDLRGELRWMAAQCCHLPTAP